MTNHIQQISELEEQLDILATALSDRDDEITALRNELAIRTSPKHSSNNALSWLTVEQANALELTATEAIDILQLACANADRSVKDAVGTVLHPIIDAMKVVVMKLDTAREQFPNLAWEQGDDPTIKPVHAPKVKDHSHLLGMLQLSQKQF